MEKILVFEFRHVPIVPPRIRLKFPLATFIILNMEAQKTT